MAQFHTVLQHSTPATTYCRVDFDLRSKPANWLRMYARMSCSDRSKVRSRMHKTVSTVNWVIHSFIANAEIHGAQRLPSHSHAVNSSRMRSLLSRSAFRRSKLVRRTIGWGGTGIGGGCGSSVSAPWGPDGEPKKLSQSLNTEYVLCHRTCWAHDYVPKFHQRADTRTVEDMQQEEQ